MGNGTWKSFDRFLAFWRLNNYFILKLRNYAQEFVAVLGTRHFKLHKKSRQITSDYIFCKRDLNKLTQLKM